MHWRIQLTLKFTKFRKPLPFSDATGKGTSMLNSRSFSFKTIQYSLYSIYFQSLSLVPMTQQSTDWKTADWTVCYIQDRLGAQCRKELMNIPDISVFGNWKNLDLQNIVLVWNINRHQSTDCHYVWISKSKAGLTLRHLAKSAHCETGGSCLEGAQMPNNRLPPTKHFLIPPHLGWDYLYGPND